MFCSSKFLVCDEKLIFELIELFVDYKMASLVSLCRLERLAQNRLYENECMESQSFYSTAVSTGYSSIAIRWKNSFHKGFVENFMGYLLKKNPIIYVTV